MRLTLRTLLAYMDDLLEPEQAKEIGAKIHESSMASTLVNRIREVMRRRRLAAPEVSGPGSGIDPNAISEYLDNTLSPDQVADIERICLESDVNLAEVAACHQVLALVLGEPVDISPNSRERMYALGPALLEPEGRASGDVHQLQTETTSNMAAMETQEVATVGSPQEAKTAEPFGSAIPEYLQSGSSWKRTLPYAVVGIVAFIWVGLVMFDPELFPTDELASNSTGNGDAENLLTELDLSAPALQFEDQDNQSIPETEPVVVPVLETVVASVNPPASIDPPPPPDAPDTTTKPVPSETPAPKPPVTNPVPTVIADATKSKPATPESKKPVVNLQVIRPEKKAGLPQLAPEAQYASLNGIMLYRDNKKQKWFVAERQSEIKTGQFVASPEPYRSVIDIEQGRSRVTLVGGTAVKYVGPTEAALYGFEVQQGRIILEGSRLPDAENAVTVMSLSVGGELWRLELLSADTICGVEIIPGQPNQLEQSSEEIHYTGKLYVAAGSVRFADGKKRVRVINESEWIALSASDRDSDEAEGPAGRVLLTLPDWLDQEPKPLSSIHRRYATLFEKEFDDEQPVALSIPALIKDPRPRISELAVKCLTVTGSYEPLLQALATAEHREARMAAIDGLRNWLPREAGNGEKLKTQIGKFFPASDVETLYQLIWGFNEEDAHQGLISSQLVDWLEHGQVAVRELAFYHVHRLTDRTYDYRSSNSPSQRKSAVNRWRNHVSREGALIRR